MCLRGAVARQVIVDGAHARVSQAAFKTVNARLTPLHRIISAPLSPCRSVTTQGKKSVRISCCGYGRIPFYLYSFELRKPDVTILNRMLLCTSCSISLGNAWLLL